MPRKAAKATGKAGDWMVQSGHQKPASSVSYARIDDESNTTRYYEELSVQESEHSKVLTKLAEGNLPVSDAVLFCGRFDRNGMLVREGKTKPYRLLRCDGEASYRDAIAESRKEWGNLDNKIREARERRAKIRNRKARLREDFFSSSDLGSTYTLDPNQFTEFTPYFNGPFAKQQYFDYFIGHSRAFQQSTHGIGKRVVDILVQYALGRAIKVKCSDEKSQKKWKRFAADNRLYFKLRKYWAREYLIYGENFIDTKRWVSIDASTIYDIVCEGFGEYIDKPLYYQQMFQTPTQTYSGIKVPGVPGSGETKTGHFVIRQIPYDQVIHIKTNVVSVEKRGRSVLFAILGWIKRLSDSLNAKALAEQLRASFVWDDTIDGSADDVAAHAAMYNYIPVAPSLFVHNKAVERKPLAPLGGVTQSTDDIVQELIAFVAAITGIPKEHLNCMSSGSGNRATAIVGSEPFTKVIEDLQEDMSDLLHQIIRVFCENEKIDYDEEDWRITFPSVVKDTTSERLTNSATCENQGWFSKERAATIAASEMEQDDYTYEAEQKVIKAERDKAMVSGGLFQPGVLPPASRFEKQKNPIHGQDKQETIDDNKTL